MKNYPSDVSLRLRMTYSVHDKTRKYSSLLLASHEAIIGIISMIVRFNLHR